MPIPYFDYAATTPVDPRVIPAMVAMLGPEGTFANPASSAHQPGRDAAARVEAARLQVAALLHADVREIVFTSGATEADNLAIKGLAANHPGGHIVTSAIEHKAVLDPCAWLEQRGWQITRVAPQADGRIDPQAISAALRADTFLVSLIHANNETGVINDIAGVADICRAREVVLHVDAAQTAGKLELDMRTLPLDLVSISAHKLYGPKGIGVLYVRRRPGLDLVPLLHGGGHERGRRSGTLPSQQIVGMGMACELAATERDDDNAHIARLRDQLWQGIAAVGDVHSNGTGAERLPGHLNVAVGGVRGELLLNALGASLAISSASACLSASLEPSYVLTAMGLDAALAHASVRFSLGRFTSDEEVASAIAIFTQTVSRLRG